MVVTAVRHLRTQKGSTKSHLLECDDGHTYLVKFQDGTRAVINEHVGYSIARYLGLPVPASQHVEVPRGLIEAADALRKQRVTHGVHHGSQFLEGCVDFRRIRSRYPVIENADVLPGFIVLDNFIMNPDRDNADNNLLQISPSGGVQYTGVDFDEILAGPKWTTETLNIMKDSRSLMPVFPVAGASVRGMSSFSPWLEKVEAISAETIERILSEVPGSWNVLESEKSAVSEFLLARKDLLRDILLANRQRFPNWTDP